jgi:hypothetical protein
LILVLAHELSSTAVDSPSLSLTYPTMLECRVDSPDTYELEKWYLKCKCKSWRNE